MLRVTPSLSADGARRYFDDELQKGDYYTNDPQTVGRWHGRGAALLGLEGHVKREQFHALTENLHPETGERLTVRTKDGRRIGFNFTFSAKKSISILHTYTGDDRIVEAFRTSVRETMQEIENNMETRVRKLSQSHDRKVANMLWSEFVHFGSRPVENTVDPHLHCHAYAFNAVFDVQENRWKAGQFGNLKRDAPYFEAVFDARFARRLEDMGYATERRGRKWELIGIPEKTIDRFSRRKNEIEQEARKRGIKNAKQKAALGVRTRRHKSEERHTDHSHASFLNRLTPSETQMLDAIVSENIQKQSPRPTADAAIDYAITHSFERKSVVPERRLLAEAMKFGVGTLLPEEIETAWQARRGILKRERNGQCMVTTQDILQEEKAMLRFSREGKGQYASFVPNLKIQNPNIDTEGKRALKTLLGSKDRVTGLRGGAGTGKTFITTEAARQLKSAGHSMLMLAPTASASRGTLKKEGFHEADTLARFFRDPDFQQKAKGGIVWIDEAGLIGAKTMRHVFDTAEKLHARVILVGDDRQHNSVERGDAFRTLREHGGLKTATLSTIRRQKSGWYKNIISLLAEGKHRKGLDRLMDAGAVREIADSEERRNAVAEDYRSSTQSKQSVLVIVPTHHEGEQVTAAIRERLKQDGSLNGKTRTYTTQQNMNLTEAQKADPAYYEPGHKIQFDQNAKGFQRGGKYIVQERSDRGEVLVEDPSGNRQPLPLHTPDRFTVYRSRQTEIMVGDTLRITKNGWTQEKHRIDNGRMFRVKGFDTHGGILLDHPQSWVLPKNFGHFTHGYVSTSPSAQGRTVDKVLMVQSEDSFPATNAEQFYVSASRGRHHITLYTDDAEGLRDAIVRSGKRLAAVDLFPEPKKTNRSLKHLLWLRRVKTLAQNLSKVAEQTRESLLQKFKANGGLKSRGWEPEL